MLRKWEVKCFHFLYENNVNTIIVGKFGERGVQLILGKSVKKVIGEFLIWSSTLSGIFYMLDNTVQCKYIPITSLNTGKLIGWFNIGILSQIA